MSKYTIIDGELYHSDELYHYGVKGMKWGHRKKYYNSDGSLNRLGQARQNYKSAKKAANRAYDKAHNYSAFHPVSQFVRRKNIDKSNALWKDQHNKEAAADKAKKEYKKAKQEYKNSPEGQAAAAKRAKALKVGAAVAGTALAAYGAYKFHNFIRDKNADIAVKRGNEAYRKIFDDNTAKARELSRMGDKFGGKVIDSEATVKRFKYAAENSKSVTRKNMFNNEVAVAEAMRNRYKNSSDRAYALSTKLLTDKNHMDKLYKEAGNAYMNTYNSVKNANFAKATKNVYDEYRKRKRK